MASHNVVSNTCATEEELKSKLKKLMAAPANVETATNLIYERLIEDVLLGLAFETHQLNRLGGIPVMTEEDIKQFAVVGSNDTDNFGLPVFKTAPDCCCPVCNQRLAASRFAPHLGSCLGMGRTSSRIASRRNANNCKENTYVGTSDDDDEYWPADQEKSKVNKKVEGKRKKTKNGVRKVKTQKIGNDKNHLGKIISEDYNSQSAKYDPVDNKG